MVMVPALHCPSPGEPGAYPGRAEELHDTIPEGPSTYVGTAAELHGTAPVEPGAYIRPGYAAIGLQEAASLAGK